MTMQVTQTRDEPKLALYIQEAFMGKMPKLISFVQGNQTVLNLAKHLKRHTSGSPRTLYQYTFGIRRFCRWLGISLTS